MIQSELRKFNNAYDGKSEITVGTMVMLVGKLKSALTEAPFREFEEARAGSQLSNNREEFRLAYDFWNFTIETIAHLESNLNGRSPSSPWKNW
jgi:hypothetical protein